jgi:hypothetical protein
MAIHVFIDGEFFKRFESPQEINEQKDSIGNVVISKSEAREDGDGHNLYMVTVKEEQNG